MNPAGIQQKDPQFTLDQALDAIRLHCMPLPAERVSLQEAYGRVLRENILAEEDMPAFDRSAMDGFAIRRDTESSEFCIVDELRAGDWRPRELKPSEAIRISTGAALPGDGLRVVKKENTEVGNGFIQIVQHEDELNIRFRGEDKKKGAILAYAGQRLNAGLLALLANIGHVEPLVAPALRIMHLTTGNEIVAPDQKPGKGQIRDCNSILLNSLLRSWPCKLFHAHLQEDFHAAWAQLDKSLLMEMNMILVSGGASVGEHDFTRLLFEQLGFEIIFSKNSLRPGKPTIFGKNGSRVAFGLPGNPLAHYICFHLHVATALARLSGLGETPQFHAGTLASEIKDKPCPRETLWPAHLSWRDNRPMLIPLKWQSSGDITCLANTNAILRVPPRAGSLTAGSQVEFLQTDSMVFSSPPKLL